MDFLPEPLYTHAVYFNYPVKKLLDRTTTSVTLEGLDLSAAPALSRQSCFPSLLWTWFRLEVRGPRERQLEGPLIFISCMAEIQPDKHKNRHLTQT